MAENSAQAEYEAVGALMQAAHGTSMGKMFGMPVLKAGSKAFAGFSAGAMVFKLAAPAHAAALALPGAHLFDPMGQGRAMREWVVVPAAQQEQWAALAQQAFEYVTGQL